MTNRAVQKMVGYSSVELIGLRVTELVPPEYRATVVEHITTGNEIPYQLVVLRKDGSTFPVEAVGKNCFYEGRWVRVAIVRDLTEEKKREQQLLESQTLLEKKNEELMRSNEALEQFGSLISHQLREPLRVIATYCGLLQERLSGAFADEIDEIIRTTVETSTRMQKLIEHILAYSKAGAQLNLEWIDCNSLYDEALRNLHELLYETRGAVTRDHLPEMMGDRLQLVQVFQNLISNGLKFHGQSYPAVHVTSTQDETQWIFSVKDNGVGIAPELKDQIFIRFARTEGSVTGSGLGLAICKKIVETHRGRLWFESEPNKGSTFLFSIPRTNDHGSPA